MALGSLGCCILWLLLFWTWVFCPANAKQLSQTIDYSFVKIHMKSYSSALHEHRTGRKGVRNVNLAPETQIQDKFFWIFDFETFLKKLFKTFSRILSRSFWWEKLFAIGLFWCHDTSYPEKIQNANSHTENSNFQIFR